MTRFGRAMRLLRLSCRPYMTWVEFWVVSGHPPAGVRNSQTRLSPPETHPTGLEPVTLGSEDRGIGH
jgi:hypothetical protein